MVMVCMVGLWYAWYVTVCRYAAYMYEYIYNDTDGWMDGMYMYMCWCVRM